MTLVPMPAPPAHRVTWVEAMERGNELAERIANTDFVPKALRGNPPAILAAILYGHEIGLEPMQSLSTIHVIEGRPTLSAEAMRSLILREGHELVIEEATPNRATVAGKRAGDSRTSRVTWTLDDAKRARIAGRPNWQAYPRQMLVARATAELARQLFADVIRGYAATEEARDGDVIDAEVVADQAADQAAETKPKPATRRRSRASSSSPPAPDTTPEPEPQPARVKPPLRPPGERLADPPLEPDEPLETIAGPTPFEPPAEAKGFEPPDPDAPEPEPAAPDPPNPAALRKMFALFGEKGPHERDERLAYCEHAVGRKIDSSNQLTALDVTRIIEALEAAGDLPADEQALVDEARDLFNATEAEPPLEP
jgi:hypothetical protein